MKALPFLSPVLGLGMQFANKNKNKTIVNTNPQGYPGVPGAGGIGTSGVGIGPAAAMGGASTMRPAPRLGGAADLTSGYGG
jgi:hypothetical protein